MAIQGTIDVLVVDDGVLDAELTEIGIKGLATRCRTHRASDGDVALQFLRRQGQYGNAPRPHLVLLDIKMPRKGGIEVLQEMKRDPALASIPVVMLTSSSDRRDVEQAYMGHANGYLVKSVDFREFEASLAAVEAYWFRTVLHPLG